MLEGDGDRHSSRSWAQILNERRLAKNGDLMRQGVDADKVYLASITARYPYVFRGFLFITLTMFRRTGA